MISADQIPYTQFGEDLKFQEKIYSDTVKPDVSKLFGKRKNVYYRQVVYYLAGDLC